MWWSDRPAAGKPARAARIGALVLAAGALPGLLGGCGFERTYAARDGGGSPIRQEMSQIAVAPIPERTGQLVRNTLLDHMTPLGQPDRPAYRLEVRLKEETNGLSLAHDSTITRYKYTLKAAFQLSDARSGQALLVDHARAITPYNVTRSEFSTQVSAEDAASRSAELVANAIEGRIAAYFSRTAAAAASR